MHPKSWSWGIEQLASGLRHLSLCSDRLLVGLDICRVCTVCLRECMKDGGLLDVLLLCFLTQGLHLSEL